MSNNVMTNFNKSKCNHIIDIELSLGQKCPAPENIFF